jgi:beta-N-acetylhexosaminidase
MSSTPTLREKIGQLLLVGFRGYEVKESDPIVRDIVERNLGAVILFDQEMADASLTGRNIQSPEQVKALTASLQSYAATPLLIAIDQEGGRVNRLKPQYGFPDTLSHEELGVQDDPAVTSSEGEKIAKTLAAAGINFNLAPVVDLDLTPDNPIIKGKRRSFSSDLRQVASHARVYVLAHQAHKVLTCLKHFPGHGSARGDTHLGLVDVTATWSEKELGPFYIFINSAACDAIMTAHVFNSKLDPKYPATLSRAIIHDLLRVKMKYDGVVFTDDMEMKAITSQFGLEEAIALAINAGVDILCFGNNMSFDAEIGRKASDLILRLVESGKIPESRIDESFARVQRLKQKAKLR